MTYADLLDMLRGSPSGTTEHMLLSHGASAKQLARLEESGDARVAIRTLAAPAGLRVKWFFPAN